MHRDSWQQSIAKTGYALSVMSYVVFWLADLLRPGIVSRYMSVHLFLLSAIIFGCWWAVVDARDGQKWRERSWMVYGAGITLGILLAALVWMAGVGLAEYRLLLTALAVFIPMLGLNLIRSE